MSTAVPVHCQIRNLPFLETFDDTPPPGLPAGWQSSCLRVPGVDDFVLSTGSPSSAPNCVYAVNATLPQWMASPVFDLTDMVGGRIRWNMRRSATFGAAMVLEASVDGGGTYPFGVGDTIRVADPGLYISVERVIPAGCAGKAHARFRWRVIPEAQGSAGTLRIDDVVLEPAGRGVHPGRVCIEEIMYAPAGGEPEWAEIVNADSLVINMKGWSISDASVLSRHLIAGSDLLLQPGERLVLTRDSAALAAVRFTPGWKVGSVAGFPSLNNSGDAIVIFRPDGSEADSLSYRPGWGGALSGISLERWDTWGLSRDSANWGACVDPSGATPGRMNSIGRRKHDVAVSTGDATATRDGNAVLRVHVRNRGRESAHHLRVEFYRALRQAGRYVCADLIGTGSDEGPVAPLDSLPVELLWSLPPSGNQLVLAAVAAEEDERRDNDTAAFVVRVPAAPGSVVVNEILFTPLPGEPEYVELVNAGNRPVNIAGWTLHDRRTEGTTGAVSHLPDDGVLLPPGAFAVIAGDSTICRFFPQLRQLRALVVPPGGLISLNNDGDDVVVQDPWGGTIDSVRYSPSWHSPAVIDATGRSLERRRKEGESRDPSNWSTCTLDEGGSPGRENSIALASASPGGGVTCRPNPFSPDGDGVDDVTLIHVVLPPGSWSLTADVYDGVGRVIRRLASALPAEREGDVVWDGRDDLQRKARVGPYIVVVEAWDPARGASVRETALVILAGKL